MTTQPKKADFSFTKLVVDDLERQAAFYTAVFGLNALQRIQSAIGPDEIDEIIMNAGSDFASGGTNLILLKFTKKARPEAGAVILGFTTPDLPALIQRAQEAGGSLAAALKHVPEMNIKVAFLRDLEGHLIEVVQML